MKQYEDGLHEEWVESVGVTLPNLLKRTVLSKPSVPVHRIDSHAGFRTMSTSEYSHLLPPGISIKYTYYKVGYFYASYYALL